MLQPQMPPAAHPPGQRPQNLAPLILRETKLIRSLIEDTILPENPNGDGADGDPIQSMLDVQASVLKALQELKASVEALHQRLDAPTLTAPAGAR